MVAGCQWQSEKRGRNGQCDPYEAKEQARGYHNLRRDIPEVVYVMGNSVGIARKHYVREVTKEWNDKFWAMKPTP